MYIGKIRLQAPTLNILSPPPSNQTQLLTLRLKSVVFLTAKVLNVSYLCRADPHDQIVGT